jgi:hypothetical protein
VRGLPGPQRWKAQQDNKKNGNGFSHFAPRGKLPKADAKTMISGAKRHYIDL